MNIRSLLMGMIIALSLMIAGEAGAADIQAQLDDNAGASAFSILDSDSAEQAYIDSNGNLLVNGTATAGSFVGNFVPVYARVSGSNATTTGQTLVDITGLSVALTTNAAYEFEAELTVTSSSSAGNRYGVQFSAAGGAVEAQIEGTRTATLTTGERVSALNTNSSVAYITQAADGAVLIKGILTTGANAGNLTIQHLKVTSGTSTVYINSFLKVTRIA